MSRIDSEREVRESFEYMHQLMFFCVGTIQSLINDAFLREAFCILAIYLFWRKRKLYGLFRVYLVTISLYLAKNNTCFKWQ